MPTKKSPLETDIFNYHTPEFFINMKNIPDKASTERKSFVLGEKDKCRNGINVNGIYIPGGLYMHLNYYYLEGDSKTNPGKKEIMLPTLRDNEWIIFNDYDWCKKNFKSYPLFGARQISKSETEVSLCLGELSLWSPTEAMALFANDNHRDTFVKKARTALEHGEKFIYVPNINKDWSNNEIRFGLTRQDNTTDLRGTLYIYNTQEGKKIQVGSGKTLSFLLIDEAATAPFQSIIDTLEPALLTDSGKLRCSPIIAFTGGETVKAEDAKNMIESPSKNGQFTTTLDNGTIIGGRFMDGRYRKDCKVKTTIFEYTKIKTDTWIDDYSIMATDFDHALKVIHDEREEAAKSPNKQTLTLKKIFFPLTIEEVFLTDSNNSFPVEECKLRKRQLEDLKWEYVDLYRGEKNVVLWKFSDKTPITVFPVKQKDFKDSPFVVCEHPQDGVPHGTYIIGIDPYNEDVSSDREPSLGSIHVYKRMYNPFGVFQNQIVAYWTGRKKSVKEFHELCLMVAEYYNAKEGVLPENEDKTLIQYFFLKHKGHYLADSFELAKEISNGLTKTRRLKGLSASTTNQRHYMGLEVSDATDEVEYTTQEGDTITQMGVFNVNDPMLLEEYTQYKGKPKSSKGIHDGNYDRIVSYGHCLTLAKYYDVKYPTAGKWKPAKDEDEMKYPPKIRFPWGNIETQHNPFKNVQHKPKGRSGSKQFI
tara:strand:+ start:1149 stop:3254 length:2106 start_codon:yes stop_codon:yes gene_type:complete